MLPELERVPRLKLASTPTALQEAPRLAAAMGLRRLLVKRDDNTGLAFGGNKARKLEYLVADAVGAGADVLLTVGGPQSNHCRSTAAAARQAGLEAQLVFINRATLVPHRLGLFKPVPGFQYPDLVPCAVLDYAAVVDTDTLKPIRQIEGEALLALAVKFGETRLIDNVVVASRAE